MMSEFYYLIALALIEQQGKRFMPLGGKSIKELECKEEIMLEKARPIALEVLLRVFEKSDEGLIRRFAANQSLLIANLPMNEMQINIPKFKSEWIEKGNTPKFISDMNNISLGLWTVEFIRYEGIKFSQIK